MENEFSISGIIVDPVSQEIFRGKIRVIGNTIQSVERSPDAPDQYILPGFIDAHVHVESSMLIPSEFARLAVVHGTVATVSDPHEIGNVCGMEGVLYMIENGKKVPFKFNFGAPSCVPATKFETAGAEIGVADIQTLMAMPEIRYLAEMMNFPGVLHVDPEVMAKIAAAHAQGKVVDGHAPGLRGEEAARYAAAGISTDHECFTEGEARDKLAAGMKILIREGSAAKNFEALIPLLDEFPDKIMFCSDDKHPNDLVAGHINLLAARAVAKGIDPMKVVRACSLNVVHHYGLEVGLLQPGDPADFIICRDLVHFETKATYINGQKVADNGKSLIESVPERVINHFKAEKISANDLAVPANGKQMRVIQVEDGQLITHKSIQSPRVENGMIVSDPDRDLLKMVVFNRHKKAPPAVAFVQNFGFQKGAIASTVAHDSHNIIAVGVDDLDLTQAINLLVEAEGGVSLACGDLREVLPLEVGGLMSRNNGYEVAIAYEKLDQQAKGLGTRLAAPYMTLSFCALLVIPELKLSDLGLFDGNEFKLISLFEGA
ncbi:MAG: adenine deaminase [Bacteroidia bacterium]|nr:adenine deaminase [Bacteroidia bacterium]